MEKITREQVATYLNTTPLDTTSWELVGVGITSFGQAYNPQITTEKWITKKNATSDLNSYQIQGEISQKCYTGDAIFEYINDLRRNASIGSDVETEILDIDMWDEVTDGVYNATKNDCIIAITKYMAEEAVIEYSIYYNGDPTLGTVTITDGVPVFTESASL